ncbi:predicted protein [Arabidopsis lyrata subsp. lyrata]|uniref:Predicted protein n=1 Tax=Arabidopsis lyrata subsp. lyrata TaxID=81972 RepID=D7LT82_ARALL|nr:predicted protein [Arabidopsis lyrata subsp. lyrata]
MADAGGDAGQKEINERVLCWVIAFFVAQREQAVFSIICFGENVTVFEFITPTKISPNMVRI